MDTYQDYRPFLHDGDILEWSSDAIIGRLIQLFAKTDVNHTSGVIRMKQYEDDPGDRVFTTEAISHGVSLTYLSRALQGCRKRVYWLPLKPEYDKYRRDIARAQLSMVGVPYDYQNLFKSALGRVSTNAKRLFCSEMIGWSLEQAGVIPKQPSALWPGEFAALGIFQKRVRIF